MNGCQEYIKNIYIFIRKGQFVQITNVILFRIQNYLPIATKVYVSICRIFLPQVHINMDES